MKDSMENDKPRGVIGEIKYLIFKDWLWPLKILWLSFIFVGIISGKFIDTFLFIAISYLFYDVMMMMIDEDRKAFIDKF
jgi:hypothetical protein